MSHTQDRHRSGLSDTLHGLHATLPGGRQAAPWSDWLTLLHASFPGSYARRARDPGQSTPGLRLDCHLKHSLQTKQTGVLLVPGVGRDGERGLQLAAARGAVWLSSPEA